MAQRQMRECSRDEVPQVAPTGRHDSGAGGGVEALGPELHSYDDRWAGIYLDHRRRIRGALAALDVEIEHIGSTSVPGLAAKPIIDIVVVVDGITAEENYLDALLEAGYELRVREPRHRLVRTPARDVHVHLYERNDPAVGEYLLFRDHLRSERVTVPSTRAPRGPCSASGGTT